MDPATNSVLSTTLTVAVSANTLFNLGIGWVTWSLRSSAAKVARLEDKLEKAESGREAKQHELTDKLIDARLRDFTHQLGQLMQKAQTTSDAQEKFIEQAERKMEALGQRDQTAELKTLGQIKDLQIDIAKNAITRQDMKAHEEAMRREMAELRQFVRQGRQ